MAEGPALGSWEDEPIIMRPLEEDECIVEKILDKRINNIDGKPEYFIKWKDFPESENSWEPAENINCDKLLPEFEAELAKKEDQGQVESNNKLQEDSSSSSTSSTNANSSATSTVSIVDLLTMLTLEKKENARLEAQLAVRQRYLQDLKDELDRLNKANREAEAALAAGGEAWTENCTANNGVYSSINDDAETLSPLQQRKSPSSPNLEKGAQKHHRTSKKSRTGLKRKFKPNDGKGH